MKKIVQGGVSLLIIVAVVGGYFWVQHEINVKRKAARAQLEATLAQAQKTVEQTKASVVAQQTALNKSREQIAKLERTLRRHDLSHLAKAKPCLIAKRMTNATRVAYAQLAQSTGTAIENTTGRDPTVCKKPRESVTR